MGLNTYYIPILNISLLSNLLNAIFILFGGVSFSCEYQDTDWRCRLCGIGHMKQQKQADCFLSFSWPSLSLVQWCRKTFGAAGVLLFQTLWCISFHMYCTRKRAFQHLDLVLWKIIQNPGAVYHVTAECVISAESLTKMFSYKCDNFLGEKSSLFLIHILALLSLLCSFLLSAFPSRHFPI